MSENIKWDNEHIVSFLNKRSIDNYFPVLKHYLYPGAKVLDVGCGPGTITVGAAAAVGDGTVVGVDLAEQSIQSSQKLAEQLQLSNATFQVMDAYNMEFADGTFDITYSNNVLVWTSDPIRFLQEQKRVTRPGGIVIAGISDWGGMLLYPPSPAMETVVKAFVHLNDPADPGVFLNPNLGRSSLALFSNAGFNTVRIEGQVSTMDCAYQGSPFFEDRYHYLKLICNSNSDLRMEMLHKKLIGLGHLDEATLQAAQAEIEVWHNHPHAFQLETRLIVVGEVD